MPELILTNNRHLKKVETIFLKNFERELPLPIMAELVGVTPEHLSRLFVNNTGMSYSDWIAKSRVELACRLLKETDFSISEVGLKVGFAAPSTFRRRFQEFTHMSPRLYKKRCHEPA